MGYDMYSKSNTDDGGYFRLNIWGMGWMREVMLQADAGLEDVIHKFCSNDGLVVTEKEGKRIGLALRGYLKDNPVGAVPKRKARTLAPHEAAASQLTSALGAMFGEVEVIGDPGDKVGKKLTQDDADIIADFAKYNETSAPYSVC